MSKNDFQKIGVFVLSKNSAKYMDRVLASLKDFTEVSLYDSGSTDQTLQIAQKYSNVTVHRDPVWTGFGDQYQKAADSLASSWVFKVDSDEVLSDELIAELKNIDLTDEKKLFKMNRLNHYRGKVVRVTTWAKDEPLRIFNKKHTGFNRAQVHEVVVVKNDSTVESLDGVILHYPYDSVSSLIQRMDHYSELYALGHPEKNFNSLLIALRFFFSFFKNYILKRGFLMGRIGLLISFCNASGAFFKYMKIAEKADS